MNEVRKLCSVCGKIATDFCKLCGKPVCREHYDAKSGFCSGHARGRTIKKGT